MRFFNKGLTTPKITQGTWTPTIQDSSLSDGEGQTYTSQSGSYMKIKNYIFITGDVGINSLGTLTTTQGASIAGLPFTSVNDGNNVGAVVIQSADSLSITAGHNLTGAVAANSTRISLNLYDSTIGTSTFLISELTAGGRVSFVGFYRVE